MMDAIRRHRAGASRLVLLLVVSALLAGCAAGRAFGRGEDAARSGDWDAAVEYYREAVQQSPDRADYQIALAQAMRNASFEHLDLARVLEAQGRLEDALREYRRASDFDPTNRQVAAQVLEIERRIRAEFEAAQPPSSIAQLRAQAQAQPQVLPLLDPASDEPINVVFTDASLRDIITSMAEAAGINVTFEMDFVDAPYTIRLIGMSFEDALNQILVANGLFFKVVNAQTIMVIPDTVPKRTQYEEQVIQTFYVSHVDATELAQMINQVIRVPAMAVQPQIAPNAASNTITVRATTNVVSIIERMILANDNPKAEVVIDVQILEVNRSRARQLGLDLSNFSIGATFSPTVDPAENDGAAPAFNLNTVTRGISTADFYLSVPSAIVNFLESDSETRLIAKPQLRGAEGETITLNLGDEVPVPSTTFTPLAQGGANFNPLTSFNYRDVGVNISMTPRVTFEGDVMLTLTVENSTRGQDVNIAGQNLPSFGTRRVETQLRLRDGESNLLAGLLREEERTSLRGIPGINRIPILNRLFGAEDTSVLQTDIVMLLTPRIVRTHELTAEDVAPIFIGTSQNMELGSAPPVFAGAAGVAAVEAPAAAQALDVPVPGVPGAADGQLIVSPPATDFQVGGGPYTIPVSIAGASRVGALSVTLTYDPTVLRVQAVQEGTFMRAGGAQAVFTQQIDAVAGRVDVAVVRPGAPTGAAGTGVVAAVIFEAIGAGPANLSVTSAGTAPDGQPLAMQQVPVPGVVVGR